MGDEELHELAFEFFDLTDTAQQALRSEMRSRGLGDPQAASDEPKFSGCSKLNRPRSVFSPSSPLSESADRATGRRGGCRFTEEYPQTTPLPVR